MAQRQKRHFETWTSTQVRWSGTWVPNSIRHFYTHTPQCLPCLLTFAVHLPECPCKARNRSLQHLGILQFDLYLRVVQLVLKQGSRLGRREVTPWGQKVTPPSLQEGKILKVEDPLELALLRIYRRAYKAVSSYSHLVKKELAAISHSILNTCK